MPETNITIRDVAREAGVSIATVSKVLSNTGDFLESTRQLVWNTAHRMGYEPNQKARNLRAADAHGRPRTNLILHVFQLGQEEPIGDPVISESAMMCSWVAGKHGLFTTTYPYYGLENFRCPLLLDRLIDGVIIGSPHKEVIELLSSKVPVVAVNVNRDNRAYRPTMVNPALEDGLNEMFHKAYALGHRNATVIVNPEQPFYFANNYSRLLLRLLTEIGFSIRNVCLPESLTKDNHRSLMKDVANDLIPLIKSRKTSLIVCEDMVYAESVVETLRNAGIRIPEDVSIICPWTTCGMGSPLVHEITSVAFDWKSLYTTAIEVLQNMIDGKTTTCSEFLVRCFMNWGSTLGEPPQKK